MEEHPKGISNATEYKSEEVVKVGVVVGAGTGLRLSEIFKSFLRALVEKYSGKQVEFEEDLKEDGNLYIYHSYKSLVDFAGNDASTYDIVSREEVGRLLNLTQKWHKAGVRVIFRTSINAEALYLFRQKVGAVKVFGLETLSGNKILFVRDQAEGFYANTDYRFDDSGECFTFEGRYSKAHQQKVVRFALKEAERFMAGKPYQKWAIYKLHLFANLIEKWMHELDPSIQTYQPDNGLTKLLELTSKGHINLQKTNNILCICSNEVGDITYEAILGAINIGPKLELYTRNVYLEQPYVGEMVEYQTVHGSADDLAGEPERLIPYATLRIVADLAEQFGGAEGVKASLEKAIAETKQKQTVTTSQILQMVAQHLNLHIES